MLVLSRRVGESLIIGESGQIKITILGIKGNCVRVGTDAPSTIPVNRKEVYDRILAKAANDETDIDSDS